MTRTVGIGLRKTVKNIIVTLLILILGATTAILIYLHFFASDEKNLSGEWTAELDITQTAAVTAFCWLQEIEAVSVSLEDMESYMQDLTIRVQLTLEETAGSGGTFSCRVLPESYDVCNQAAYEAFAAAFRELVAERLRMAGYGGSTDREAVEALVTETFGMSTVSYLMACGPALLPDLEKLQAQYDGSGTYETADGVLTWQYDDGGVEGTRREGYIRKGSTLILTESTDSDSSGLFWDPYPLLYTLSPTQTQ